MLKKKVLVQLGPVVGYTAAKGICNPPATAFLSPSFVSVSPLLVRDSYPMSCKSLRYIRIQKIALHVAYLQNRLPLDMVLVSQSFSQCENLTRPTAQNDIPLQTLALRFTKN